MHPSNQGTMDFLYRFLNYYVSQKYRYIFLSFRNTIQAIALKIGLTFQLLHIVLTPLKPSSGIEISHFLETTTVSTYVHTEELILTQKSQQTKNKDFKPKRVITASYPVNLINHRAIHLLWNRAHTGTTGENTSQAIKSAIYKKQRLCFRPGGFSQV